ncbi:MAG: chorismate-binding protein, partial [Pseudomonadales bacterium]|nr:chorismate-binding protein [Pseudomonadales bacterium]
MTAILQQPLPYHASSTELYRKIAHLPMPVLLASGSIQHPDARFDILSAAPIKTLKTWGAETLIESADGTCSVQRGNPLDILKENVQYPALDVSGLGKTPFVGGAIGYFAYDLLHESHQVPSVRANDDISLPAMLVGIYHWAVILDHQEKRCTFLCLSTVSKAVRQQILDCLDVPLPASAAQETFELTGAFQSDFSRAEYQQAFARIIRYIEAGDCYQVNLAQRFSAPFKGDPLLAFARLHELARAPFSAFIKSPEGCVLSFSPERFIRVVGKRVTTQPIKGTRPRHEDPGEDR